jgi:hypothetical protein
VEGTDSVKHSVAGFRNRNFRSDQASRPWRVAAVGGVLALGAALGVPAVAAASASASTAAPAKAAFIKATSIKATSIKATSIKATPAVASAALKLKSTSGLPGQAVAFTGSGFRAKEQVTLHWHTVGWTTLAKVTAAKNGTIAGTFHVPVPKAGVAAKVAVVAIGATSKREAKATFVQNCGDEWTKLSGGDWSNAGDWSTGAVPGDTTAACITLAGSKKYTVVLRQLTGSTSVGSLQVGSQSGKTTQTFEMDANGSDMHLGLSHTSNIYAHGVLLLTSAGGGSDFIEGSGTLQNSGLLSTVGGKGWARYLYGNIVNEPSGTFSVAAGTIPAGGTYQTNLSTFVNKGKVTVAKGSEYFVSQAKFNQTAGRIANSGLVDLNNATLDKSGGTSTGNAWQFFNGAILNDKAGTGAYSFFEDGVLSGKIPAGQTVTVVGDENTGIHLQLSGNVINDGTLVMTSSNVNGGPGNAWLTPFGGGTPTLYNYGTLETLKGAAFNRFFNVNVLNEPKGTMDIDSGTNQLFGGWTLTNDGTLNFGPGAVLNLDGTSYGTASLIEGATATTSVSIGADGASSTVDQYMCSAGGCQNEVIKLAGTLKVSAKGTTGGNYFPIYSQQTAITGKFAKTPAGYTVAYNGPDGQATGVDGDVIVTP